MSHIGIDGRISGYVEISGVDGIVKSDQIEIKFKSKASYHVEYIKVNGKKLHGVHRVEIICDTNDTFPQIRLELVPQREK